MFLGRFCWNDNKYDYQVRDERHSSSLLAKKKHAVLSFLNLRRVSNWWKQTLIKVQRSQQCCSLNGSSMLLLCYIKWVGRLYWQRFLEKEQWFYTRGKRRYTISGRRSLVELQAVIFSFLTSATLPLLTCNTGAIQLAIQPVMSVTHAHTDKFTLTTHTHTQNTHLSHSIQTHSEISVWQDRDRKHSQTVENRPYSS